LIGNTLILSSLDKIPSPYSLGKLIDWKLIESILARDLIGSPYSLGKLIDWKHGLNLIDIYSKNSLLVREIN
jgi:hypothetical protein